MKDQSNQGSRKTSTASIQKTEAKTTKKVSKDTKKIKKFNLNETEIKLKIGDLTFKAKQLEGVENKKKRANLYKQLVDLKKAAEDPANFIIDRKKEEKVIADRRQRVAKKLEKKAARIEEKRLAKLAEMKKRKNAARLGDRRKQCLLCKKFGHTLNECTQREDDDMHINICYNCGKKDHTLKQCPRPVTDETKMKFAKCFICKKRGHMSKDCPENDKGIYPYGGSCYFCGSKMHKKQDCTEHRKNMAQQKKAQQPNIPEKEKKQDDEIYDDPQENINEELEDDF